ncbi:DUF4870 family protein [Thalassospira sp. CH_XMU1448-2]|uniref:DUF4870 family protein n=1 Tax=Thalassospira sp. CH_XMU1448-2 TaxID=3107773 RepID=UPI0030085185
MTDTNSVSIETTGDEGFTGNIRLIYILYLVGIVLPLVGLVGLIFAYVKKGDAPEWAKTHYRFLIRTFWIYILYIVVGSITSMIIIGWFILLAALVWFIIRMVKGLNGLRTGIPHPNPTGWMI